VTPWIGPGPAEGREACPRCGFTVDLSEATQKAADKRGRTLRDILEEHLTVCPTLPSSTQARNLRRAVRSERFLHGEEAAREALEDGLAAIGRGA
jgi:hypothetical protein